MTEPTLISDVEAIATEIEDPRVARQFELETEMIEDGAHRYWDRVSKARPGFDENGHKREGEESRTPAAQCLLRMSIGPVTDGVVEFLEAAATGKAGRRHLAVKHLKLIEPEAAAFLALKRMLDGFSLGLSMASMNIRIGRTIEDEVQLRTWNDQRPHLLEAIRSRFATKNFSFHRRVLKALARRYDVDLGEPWSDNEALQVGSALVTIVIQKTGLFEVTNDGTRLVIRPTERAQEWVRNKDAQAQFLFPTYMPTVVPPKPWTGPTGGGYYFGLANKLRLVKSRSRGYQSELREWDMPDVYRAVNALQDTPWQVNTDVLEVMAAAVRSGSALAGLPETHQEPVPPAPPGIPLDKEKRTAAQQERLVQWKSQARAVYEANVERRQALISAARTVSIAEKYAAEDRFYFPYTLDFRGRAYPVPSFLQPQGCDWQKALLRFSDGVALGEQGACWLAVHGANLMSEDPTTGVKIDKLPLQGRIDWVADNEDMIRLTAHDPSQTDWWTKADSPWQFLAFCFEWNGYCQEGDAYVSHLPIALDGSCNGLQHFSAMLRDEVGGSAVNLIPHDTPADIYMEVCLATIRQVGLDAEQGLADEEVTDKKGNTRIIPSATTLAKRWLASGMIDRGLCKRPVMTMPYGSKQFGIRDQLLQEIRKRGFEFHDSDGVVTGGWEECGYLSAVIWTALGNVVVKAREAMDWLQACARIAATDELPVKWVTPDGFLVHQEYKESALKDVRTQVAGVVYKPLINVETDRLAKHKQMNGIAPNYVHSMDAAAMRGCINTALTAGISHFAMIHDSYGTHAGRTAEFYHAIRSAFVEMYTQADVLSEFRDQLKMQLFSAADDLPPVPSAGKLDLAGVMESDFFFA